MRKNIKLHFNVSVFIDTVEADTKSAVKEEVKAAKEYMKEQVYNALYSQWINATKVITVK